MSINSRHVSRILWIELDARSNILTSIWVMNVIFLNLKSESHDETAVLRSNFQWAVFEHAFSLQSKRWARRRFIPARMIQESSTTTSSTRAISWGGISTIPHSRSISFSSHRELHWLHLVTLSVLIHHTPRTQGGDLEFIPDSRDEFENLTELPTNYALLQRTQRPVLAAGSMYLFRGANALHRVTKVGPGRPRVNAICTFSETANLTLNPYTKRRFFGE